MLVGPARFVGILAATALLLVTTALAAEAKEGFYLGGGYAQQSVSGDLDGRKAFRNATDTVAILAGKPDAGTGPAFIIGYGFTPEIGLDFSMARTRHASSHTAVDFDSDMLLVTGIFSVRVGVPILENLEFTGRAGLASVIAAYDKYALKGNIAAGTYSSTGEADFSGSGYAFGIGLEYYLGSVSLSTNYTAMDITFDEAKGGGVSGELPTTLSSTISQFTFMVTYYFK